MSDTAIMWFRRDLRVRDLPALAEAATHDRLACVFVLDPRLLGKGRWTCDARTAFMVGCLHELDAALRKRGGRLAIREGEPETEVPKLAREVKATDVYFTADVSPFARGRDQRVIDALADDGVRAHAMPGAGVVEDPAKILTKQGKPYTVFSPYARTWLGADRRDPLSAPRKLPAQPRMAAGTLPTARSLKLDVEPADLVFPPGEAEGRRRMLAFLRTGLQPYDDRRNAPAGGSSRLSPYLRWGCVSPTELDARAAEHRGAGAESYRNELAWRDFYGAVLMHFPHVTKQEFQERYRDLWWTRGTKHLEAWKAGRTGYPLVDAGMRQLLAEGWMHNRVRMVVGSFLTKDLHVDWRAGERHFMEQLVDGDMAANNGGWQWIASTGTDPAPYFQRLFNPVTQQRKFDPDGTYVRRWVPELRDVPDDRLAEPWTMDADGQEAAGCRIGSDYPAPIVDHAHERRRAIEIYRGAA
jgi:deoxyribodipyrimidine photo-lyase